MAEETYRIQLETLKIEGNIAQMSAIKSHDNFIADVQQDMQAWAEKAEAQNQTSGAPPIPKDLNPSPTGGGLDTNLSTEGFVSSQVVVSKLTISKPRR